MENAARDSGIDVIGHVPWGTHFSLFYQTKQDLIDVLVPYFEAGLKNNEFCMWVTAGSLNAGEAKSYMAGAIPDFDVYFEKGQIEIIPYSEWYTINSAFDPERVLVGWVEKLRKAREQDFRGLRATGDVSWLETGGWKDFLDYEQNVNDIVGGQEMIALCTYPLDGCDANDILDVVNAHQFALTRRNGEWKIIEDQGQKKARKALLESEEKFRQLAEISPAAIIIYQGESFVYVNPAAETMTGYKLEEFLKMKPWDIVHPDYRKRIKEKTSLRMKGIPLSERYDVKLVTKDSRELWTSNSTAAIKYMDKPAGLVIAIDITERKRAEGALRESEEKLRCYYELPLIGMALTSLEKGWLQANDEICRILGYSRDELFQTKWDEITYPDDLDNDLECFNRLLSGEIDNYMIEKRFVRKNGEVIPTQISIGCIRNPDKSVRYIVGLMQDITERKQAEESLKNLETKFRTLYENARIAIFVADAETGIIVDCNRYAENLVGRPRSEVVGMHQTVLHPADEGDKYRGIFNQHIRGNLTQFDAEVQNKDGRRIPVIINAAPVVISGKDMLIGFFLDITERKQAEEALKESKAQAELYLDLMGHDINNMHQIALGYLELAQDIHPEASQNEFLDKPIEVLQRSARLIRNVRKLQKLKEGVFQTQVVDVCQLLVDLQREFGAVPHKAVTLNKNGCEQCHVCANELLHDVFANLVGNAIKHTGERADIVVNLDVVWNDGRQYCRVMVEDDGPGIPDDFKGRIFNRLMNSTDKAKGMGLGLYLVKSLVESYGGRVWVEDRVSGDHTTGARFVVILPSA